MFFSLIETKCLLISIAPDTWETLFWLLLEIIIAETAGDSGLWNTVEGETSASNHHVETVQPESWFRDGEVIVLNGTQSLEDFLELQTQWENNKKLSWGHGRWEREFPQQTTSAKLPFFLCNDLFVFQPKAVVTHPWTAVLMQFGPFMESLLAIGWNLQCT